MSFFHISETAGRIALKFGVWLATHYLGVLQKSRVKYIHLHVRTRADLPIFRTSETAGRIALKFDVWLVTHYIARRFAIARVRVCARADAPLFRAYVGND